MYVQLYIYMNILYIIGSLAGSWTWMTLSPWRCPAVWIHWGPGASQRILANVRLKTPPGAGRFGTSRNLGYTIYTRTTVLSLNIQSVSIWYPMVSRTPFSTQIWYNKDSTSIICSGARLKFAEICDMNHKHMICVCSSDTYCTSTYPCVLHNHVIPQLHSGHTTCLWPCHI